MKTTLVILASVLLVLGVMGVVFAGQQDVTATVTVNTGFVSSTISPCSDTLSFGSGNPGENLAVACQDADNGAVTVTNNPISNSPMDVDTLGTNFLSGSNVIGVGNVTYDNSNTQPSPVALSTTFGELVHQDVPVGQSRDVWYWMAIPSGQADGLYTGTITVRGA